jgi:hypothetical protein
MLHEKATQLTKRIIIYLIPNPKRRRFGEFIILKKKNSIANEIGLV